MSLLSVVQGVTAVVGVPIPAAIFPGLASNRTMQEMVALANEMAQRIAYDTRDWRELITGQPFEGVDAPEYTTGATFVVFPQNYKRLLLTSSVRRNSTAPDTMRYIPDMDEWFGRLARNVVESGGEWINYGGGIYIRPKLEPGDFIHFNYLDKNCIRLASGGNSDHFMADEDTFRLDERLLRLGMIWQWKANKGSPYAEDMGTYSDAIATAMGKDSPAPIIIDRMPRGGPNVLVDTNWSWPLGGGMVPP